MTDFLTGRCLCGDIAFQISNQFQNFYFCSCAQCRKITGSAFASNLFAPIDGFKWLKGEEKVTRYQVPNRDITKTFCPTCGSGVPKISGDGKSVMVPAGVLDQEPNIPAPKRIFQRERPEWAKNYENYHQFDRFPA
jgi:hypothetical protein